MHSHHTHHAATAAWTPRNLNYIRHVGALLAFIVLSGLVGLAHADVCHVIPGGAGNGSGWGAQAMALQTALGTTACSEIWVEQGSYVPGGGRGDSFVIHAGVQVYGGFAGGETSRAQRQPATHITILSGDIGVDDTSVGGIDAQASDIVGGNSYHVVSMTGGGTGHITASTVLDGFTITGGDANGSAPNDAGGGLLCNGSYAGVCSPTLANLAFRGNHAGRGGALFNNGYQGASSPVIDTVTFSGNAANNLGGAMLNYAPSGGTSSPAISNTTFSDNSTGGLGGAIFNQGYGGTASPSFTNVTFSGNGAASGGAIVNYAEGGASNPSSSSPTLVNVTFSGNTATNTGGAMYGNGVAGGTSKPSLTNVILWDDSAASSGPEIANAGATPSIDHSIVAGGCPSGSSCTNLVPGVPLLGTLQNNGGATQTLLPGIGSAAIDAGTCATSFDQRGVTRPQGFGCDIGAVETASPICFVNGAASGDNNGYTWANAYSNLQSALSNAGCTQIWVAKGIYVPGATRSDSFSIPSGVAVYGGFIGNETSLGQRRIGAVGALTTLSGDIGVADDASDNSYHVVRMDGTGTAPITASTVLDGFTISRGHADGAGAEDNGGGLYCDGAGSGSQCSPSLSNLSISDNFATSGAGLYDNGSNGTSSPQLRDVSFQRNSASDSGGAMCNYGDHGASSPVLNAVTFDANSASGAGGAMLSNGYAGVSNPQLSNVTFSGNTALNGAAMYGLDSSPTLVDVSFSGNAAASRGGAMYNGVNAGSSVPQLLDVILWGDSAPAGGNEIYNSGATPSIDHGIVQGGCPTGVTCINSIVGDPLLGPLQHNGGATLSMQPAMGSSAIDAGTCAIATDQRGVARPQPTGGACDVGAVEVVGRLCYVKPSASGSNDGSSWANAYTDLQAALSDATCTEIWVAAGVYLPGTAVTDAFDVHPGVAVYGGFAGGEANRSARDPAANLTLLSGDVDGNDSSSSNIDETAAAIIGNNSEHVLTMDGTGAVPITANTVLDGFTITAGNATGAYPQSLAGGLYCRGIGLGNQCSPTLANLVFIGNAADRNAGALYVGGRYAGTSTPVLTDVVFTGNHAAEMGGAMYADGYSGNASPTLVNVVFQGNSAGSDGGALYLNGAASGRSFAALSAVTFADNSAIGNGGAMYNDGHANGVCDPGLVNVTISGNNAVLGGALFDNGDTGESSPTLVNVTLSGNRATTQGGALFNDTYAVGKSSPRLTNVIAWGDTAPTGQEIFNYPNTGGAIPAINYSIVQGGDGGIANSDGSAATAFSAGSANLDADPLFGALGAHGGFTPTLVPGATGAAIDHGTATGASGTDQRGIARPQGNGIDIGAVEFRLPQDDTIFADGFDGTTP